MIQNVNAMPRIPLGVIVDAAPDPAADSAVGKKYRAPAGWLLPSADERFALHVVAAERADVAATLDRHPQWCGVLLADELRRSQAGDDIGWAAALDCDDALLPLEFVEHLRDEQVSESFVARVLTCSAWRQLQSAGCSVAALQGFFAQHKYLLMSRHIGSYQQVGRLLAHPASNGGVSAQALEDLARQTITTIMAALRRPTTRGGHGNALAHIRGYLKKRLSGAEKAALDEALEWYRLGLVPLHTPLRLLHEYFERYPDAYIDRQVYMQSRLHARFDLAALLEQLRAADGLQFSVGER